MEYVKLKHERGHHTRITPKLIGIVIGIILLIAFCLNLLYKYSKGKVTYVNIDPKTKINEASINQNRNVTAFIFKTNRSQENQEKPSELDVSSRGTMLNDLDICEKATWSKEGITVAGGKGEGSNLNQLSYPRGLFIDKAGTMFITDDNFRVIKWEKNAKSGVVVAGFGGKGNKSDQFGFHLHNLVIDSHETMFICDKGNQRIVKWKINEKHGETVASNIHCYGVALDFEGSLYVSDVDNHLVRKFSKNFSHNETVAGGNGKGSALNQLNRPHFIFVNQNLNLFIPDTNNHRIMKWAQNRKTTNLISEIKNEEKLIEPHALVVDQMENVYIVDHHLHRVVRWLNQSQTFQVLFGENRYGSKSNQFILPVDIDFDVNGNLYVTDRNNHRIQMFLINKTLCH